MKRLKKLIALLAVVFCVLPLFACDGAEIDCYYSANEQYFSYVYQVKVANSTVEAVESSAAVNPKLLDGGKWTLKDYFTELAWVCGWNSEIQQEQPIVEKNTTHTVYTFNLLQRNNQSDDDDDESSVVRTVDKGFFFNKIIYTQPNPLYESLTSYNGEPKSNTITFVLKNGLSGLPALEAAFPTLVGQADKLKMSFYWKADGVKAVGGEEVNINGERYLKWTVTEDNKNIAYSYTRPNPVGWYVVTAIVGVLVTVIILIVTKKSKKKPRIVDGTEKPTTGSRVYYNVSDNIDVFGIDDKEEKAKKELDDIFGFDDDNDEK